MCGILAGALLLAPCALWADDTLLLANGQSISGYLLRPLEKDADFYPFRNSDGVEFSIPSEFVSSIERSAAEVKEYEKLLQITPDTVAGNWRLAEWCDKNGEKARQKIHCERIIELDPDHEEARRELGYRRMIDGVWRTPDEELAAQGRVRYKGRVISIQEKRALESQAAQRSEVVKMTRNIARWTADIGTSRDQEARDQLRGVRSPIAVPGLLAALEKEKRVAARRELILALGRVGTPEAISPLLQLSIEDPSEDLRLTCLDIIKNHKSKFVTEYYISRLSPKKGLNSHINLAAYALGELGDASAVPALIDALETIHKAQIKTGGNPGQTSAGMGSSGSSSVGGLSMGSSVKIISQAKSNPEALAALKKLTGQNFGYDKARWREWHQRQHSSDQSIKIR